MSYQLSWYREGKIAQIVVNGEYPIEQIHNACVEIADYLSVGQKPTHLLMDIRKMTKFPASINQVKASADLFLGHPNMGWVILIGKLNPVANFIASIIVQMVRHDFRMVDSMEDALDILKRMDATLTV